MKQFKQVLLVTALLIVYVNMGWGQSIWTNPITGTNPNTSNPYTTGDVQNANITVSGIGRGTGINGTNADDRYNANSWNTASIDLDAYFTFTITPNANYEIDFVSFLYSGQVSSTGPANFAIRSSIDNYSSNIGTPSATGTTISLSAASFQNITSAISFRFYGWNTTNSGGTFSINNFTFNGTVSSTVILPPTPTSIAATNITSNSFTANWNTVTEATSYRLDVYTGLTTQLLNEGFDNGTTPPSGWTFTNIGGIYDTYSNYGVSSPSLKMDASGDRIETSTFSNPTQLSFWIKGQGTDLFSSFLIEEYYSGSYHSIESIIPLPTTGTTKTYSLNSFTSKVRFTYTKSGGNLAFDDVVITGTTVNTYVPGYQDKTINAPTISDAVTGLSSNTTYYYRVRAVNTNGTSSNSNVISVTTIIPSISYTWNATGTDNWTTASNWTPARNTPGLGDKLIFNSEQTLTVTNIPTQTISQIEVSGNTIVNLQAGTASDTLTLQGGTGVDLNVSSGSQLNFTGADSLRMLLQTGVTGTVSGNMTFTGANHKLTALDAGAITFNSGSIFTAGTGVNGNVFGSTGTNGSVVFSNAATYIQLSGASPFGGTTSVNIVTFQTGSLYKLQSSIFPSLTNRVYANFEYDYNGTLTNTFSGSSAWTFDNLIISQGTFNVNVSIPANCKGNITVANGSTFGFNPGSASDFSFIGSSSQTISGAGTLTFGDNVNLKINNSNGVVLQKDLTVNGGLTFVNGILNTGSNSVLFSSTASNPVELSTSYILGNAVMQTKDLGAGGLTEFLGLEIGAGSGSITGLTFTRNTGTAKEFGSSQSILCSWDISGNITAARPLTFKWFNAFDNGKVFSNVNKAQMWKSGDNGATWTTIGDPVNVYGQNPRIVSGIAASSFSIWTVSDDNAPLPVSLTSLNSIVSGKNNIKLNWTTASEVNNSGFNVERIQSSSSQENGGPSGNQNWEKIGFVSGKGTANTPTNYSFEDRNLQTGKYKYRLKQIDNNGNFEYFALNGEVEIGVPKKFDLSQNYPNPFNPVTKINFDLPTDSKVTMLVYDITGREIARLVNNEYKKAGYYTTDFNAGMMSSGVYFYSLSADNFRMTKKMVVLK